MDLLIDIATMAVMHPGGIPLTDLSLVRGDRHPLRITLLDEGTPVTPSGVRPALAIKTALGTGALVLAATNLEPVDDALGMAYVGSLGVNTTQLIAAMGDAPSIDLIGEVVLISGDGSQRTSSLIRVTVRQDIMPADIVPPVDVVVNWEEMVAAALAAQLPDALHNAGMYVTPAGGSTTLASDMTATHRRDVTYYRLPLDHHNIIGHLASTYTITAVTLRANVSSTPIHVELYKLANGSYRLLGRSQEAIVIPNANYDNTWTYPPGLEVRHDDTIILRLVTADGTDAVLALAITQVAASNPESGADIVDGLVDPQRVINPAYPDIRYLLYVRIGVSYTSGVSVGGVELATKDHFNDLTKEVLSTGEQVHQDADRAQDVLDQLGGKQYRFNDTVNTDLTWGVSLTDSSQSASTAISIGAVDGAHMAVISLGDGLSGIMLPNTQVGTFLAGNTAEFRGPSMFKQGVTMAQTLNVSGPVTFDSTLWCSGKGTFPAGVGVGNSMTLYEPSSGVQAGVIQGYKKVANGVTESGITLGTHGNLEFLKIGYDEQNKNVLIYGMPEGAEFRLPRMADITAYQVITDTITMGPWGIKFDPTSGILFDCAVSMSGLNVSGPATFSGGITMDELFVSSSYIRCKGFATSDGYVSFSSSNTEGRLVIASGKMFIGNTLSRRNVSIECLSVGMKTYTSLTKTMAGDIGLTGNSLLNMTEGDARWLKVRTDLSDAEYAALEEKDATTLYITTDGQKVYVGSIPIN